MHEGQTQELAFSRRIDLVCKTTISQGSPLLVNYESLVDVFYFY